MKLKDEVNRIDFAKKAWKRSTSLKEYFKALREYDIRVEMENRGK